MRIFSCVLLIVLHTTSVFASEHCKYFFLNKIGLSTEFVDAQRAQKLWPEAFLLYEISSGDFVQLRTENLEADHMKTNNVRIQDYEETSEAAFYDVVRITDPLFEGTNWTSFSPKNNTIVKDNTFVVRLSNDGYLKDLIFIDNVLISDIEKSDDYSVRFNERNYYTPDSTGSIVAHKIGIQNSTYNSFISLGTLHVFIDKYKNVTNAAASGRLIGDYSLEGRQFAIFAKEINGFALSVLDLQTNKVVASLDLNDYRIRGYRYIDEVNVQTSKEFLTGKGLLDIRFKILRPGPPFADGVYGVIIDVLNAFEPRRDRELRLKIGI